MKLRKLTETEVSFEVSIEADEDTCAIEGHFATDEPELDREQEREILERLNRGEVEAWCGVVVTATWRHDGITYTERDSIWGCTLSDDYTAEVVAEHHGMRGEALELLNARLENLCTQYASLARKLRQRSRKTG